MVDDILKFSIGGATEIDLEFINEGARREIGIGDPFDFNE